MSRYRQKRKEQMTPNGAEERILGLGLLSSQDCLCNWVTSCYFGNLSFNVVNVVNYLRSERRIFLSPHF